MFHFHYSYIVVIYFAEAQLPSEYRPIMTATIVARLFHRVLVQRLEREVPLSPRHKVFRRSDGLVDNVWLPRSVLRDRTTQSRT